MYALDTAATNKAASPGVLAVRLIAIISPLPGNETEISWANHSGGCLWAVGSALAIASDHAELPDFLAAEEEAVSLDRGLWRASACGSDEAGLAVRIWAVEPDAPGRDDQNPHPRTTQADS